MFDHAKTTLATRIDQLDKGTVPKDANWGMEAVVAGNMCKGISVEKRVETLYNLSVQKGQLTSAQQKELGDIYDLTSSNFIVHASTMGSMSMEKAEFQKGLERTAEGQTYLGYTLINAAVGRMAQYNLDAGVGISNYDDPANSRFKIESKGGVAAGDVAVGSMAGSTTGNAAVASVVPSVDSSAVPSTAQVDSPSVSVPQVPSAEQPVTMAKSSEGNVDWCNVRKGGQNALNHIQNHATPNFQRVNHGVFRGSPQTMVEQAWDNRAAGTSVSDGMGGTIYNIPYQNAGYQSGYTNFGQTMDYITIVVKEGTSTVWSAFPSFGNHGMKIVP